MSETNKLEYYARIFSQLKRGFNSHKKQQELSPYKPIFLLSIIELIDRREIFENIIRTNSSEYIFLKEHFLEYQKILGGTLYSRKAAFCQPFFHLINDKDEETEKQFWYLKPKADAPALEDIKDNEGRNRIKTEAKLKELIDYGKLDDELWELLQDSESRVFLVHALMDRFFTNADRKVEDILKEVDQDAKKHISSVPEPKPSERKYTNKKYLVRNRLFSKSVIYIYDYRCAVCRLMMKTDDLRFRSIVDAAHIKPFTKFINNQLSNGISLCKNHHWAFDNGCFGIDKIDDDKYLIIVSRNYEEENLNQDEDIKTIPLSKYHGKQIF